MRVSVYVRVCMSECLCVCVCVESNPKPVVKNTFLDFNTRTRELKRSHSTPVDVDLALTELPSCSPFGSATNKSPTSSDPTVTEDFMLRDRQSPTPASGCLLHRIPGASAPEESSTPLQKNVPETSTLSCSDTLPEPMVKNTFLHFNTRARELKRFHTTPSEMHPAPTELLSDSPFDSAADSSSTCSGLTVTEG